MNFLPKSYLLVVLVMACEVIASNACASEAGCQSVMNDHPELQVSPEASGAITKAGLATGDLFRTLSIVARYETNGCWSGATGNFDGQMLSVGVMQWNFGQRSLQNLLKRFTEKFSSSAHFASVRDELMPKFGKSIFDISCRSVPITENCVNFLRTQAFGSKGQLKDEFKDEINRLFNSQPMRQIQLDYFIRDFTSILDDLNRVFRVSQPKAWQVAWAMDLKTQQDRFPTNYSINKIKNDIQSLPAEERKRRLRGIVKWYDGLCDSGLSEGIKYDCPFNIKTWTELIQQMPESDREEALHFTHVVSSTARNRDKDGAYQADAFQRRATIAFGRGSVHGKQFNFLRQTY